MANRRNSNMAWEASRATLSIAGIKLIAQGRTVGGGAASDNTYTVTDIRTRRVIIYVEHATNICRFNMDAAATANHVVIKNQTYFPVDAVKNQVIHFFDTTGGTVLTFTEIE